MEFYHPCCGLAPEPWSRAGEGVMQASVVGCRRSSGESSSDSASSYRPLSFGRAVENWPQVRAPKCEVFVKRGDGALVDHANLSLDPRNSLISNTRNRLPDFWASGFQAKGLRFRPAVQICPSVRMFRAADCRLRVSVRKNRSYPFIEPNELEFCGHSNFVDSLGPIMGVMLT